MKRKLLSTLLSVAMVATLLVGCGTKAAETTDTKEEVTEEATEEATEAADDTAEAGGKIGVAMPAKDLQRWNQAGTNMKAELEAAGYEVDLQYASNDIQTQVSQIETTVNC